MEIIVSVDAVTLSKGLNNSGSQEDSMQTRSNATEVGESEKFGNFKRLNI